MIIDVTGFGWSGSGAYIDLLREYEDVQFPNNDPEFECYLLHWVDGVKDLEYKLTQKNCRVYDSDIAVKRFLKAAKRYSTQRGYEAFQGEFVNLCKEYIDSIEGKVLTLKTGSDRVYFNNMEMLAFCYNKLIELILQNDFLRKYVPYQIVEALKINSIHTKILKYHPNNFETSTHDFIDKCFSYLRKDMSKPMVMNHFFSPDCPHLFFNLVGEDVKCIVVKRDPRDTFLIGKKLRKEGISAIPTDSIDDFIWFYKTMIQEVYVDHPNVLNLNFEDIVYDYVNTVEKVELFLGLTTHIKPRVYFKPEVSINNTQIFLRENKYKNEIKKIEKELSDSLYDFSQYEIKPKFNTDLF